MNASRLNLTKVNPLIPARMSGRLILAAVMLAASAATSLSAASGGLDFDGANDYVTFGKASGLGTATFTVETWFKREGTGVSMSTGSGGVTAIPLVTKGCSEADASNKDMNYFLGIRASDNVLTADFEEGATGASPGLNHPVAGVTPVAMNVWNHAAVTYDGSKWQLFLNGALEAELVVGRPPRSDSIQHAGLGSALNSIGTAAGFFAGVLDEVRIWNYARTAGEIAASKNQQIPSAPGLLGRWALDEISGTTASDTSGSAINGTLVNGPIWTTGHLFIRVPSVMLVSPTNQSVLRNPTVTFTIAAQDDVGLAAASLSLGRVAATAVFKGPQQTEDAYLSADAPTANCGTNASLTIDGASPHAHGVLRFLDLFGTGPGQVAPGSAISTATVKVYCSNNSVSALKIYRLTEAWSEAQANWNQRSSGLPWSNPGADGTGSHAALELLGDCTATGWRTFDVTALVQEWSDGQPNYGFLLVDAGTDGIALASSESSTPPELTISNLEDFSPVESVPLAGTNAEASFTITLPGSGEYRWNCAVTNSEGNIAWAPADFRLTVDLESPEPPILASPVDGATGIPVSPILQVQANDPNGDPLTVSFYGRRRGDAGDPFTLAVLPDTQNYSQTYPAIFTGQTQWILSNRISRKIVFVSHEGDVVNTYNSATQYQNASNSLSLLDGVVPYAVLPGNHDQPSTLFNQSFAAARYEGQPWYGGHCGSSNDNSYQIFSAGGLDFVIVHLQFNPPAGVMAWADSVLKAHSNRRAILTTHGYLAATGARSVEVMGSTEHLWTQLAVPNPNVFFMLCGHEHGEYVRTDFVGDRAVHQLLADYQTDANGGNGWLRLMRFVPVENRVEVQTYSPYLGQFQTDANSQFTLDFPMAPFHLVGEVQQVPSGSLASVTWAGLTNDTEHEWYVKVTDSTGRSTVGPVWGFTTGPANLPPIASAQTVQSDEDTGLSIALSGADPEGQSLAFEIMSQPAHGVITGTPPDVIYTPNPNYFGPDSFTFRANDGIAVSETAEVSISVAPVNDAPVAFAQDTAVNEDVPLAVTLGGADLDNDPLAFTVVVAPLRGTLTGTAPNMVYTPEVNYHGPDSFAFISSDSNAQSLPAIVTIAVNPVNDPPVAIGQSVTTPEDNALPILLTAADVENNPLVFIAAQPSHGTLSGTSPNLVYTPAANYHGADSFTFKANDGQSDSLPTIVAISVASVNDAPVALAQEVVTAEDTPATITLSGTDADNDSLTFVLVSGPTNGVLGGEFPNFLYAPAPNVSGADSFIYQVNDGQADSGSATVSIIVTPVNDPPVAGEQTISTSEDATVAIELAATDVESDSLTYAVVDGPAHGTLSGTAPSLVYTPAADYHGADSFTFHASDGTNSAAATVSLAVTPVNDAPVADTQSLNVIEDTPATLVLKASDADGDPLTFTVATGPAHGSLTGSAPHLTYNPEADYFGTDSFTFKASDGTAGSLVAAISITVTPVNDAPAVPVNVTAAAGFASVQLSWNPSMDPEGDAVTYLVRRGTVSGLYDSLIPVAQPSWLDAGVTNGQTYYYAVAAVDAAGAESGASGEVMAIPRDDLSPVISAVEAINITAGSARIVWTTDEPADSTVVFGLVSQYGGTNTDTNLVTLHSVTLTGLTAGTNYLYRVRSEDAAGNVSWSEELTFATRPGNQIPVALAQSVPTPEDQPLVVTLTATDGDNDPVDFRVLTAPSHGTLAGTAPELVYTPDANYYGPDNFTFQVNDGQADSAPADVQIQVTSVNDVPVAQNQSFATAEDTGLPIALVANDVEAEPLTFTVVVEPEHGVLSGTASELVYTPTPDYHGSDSFTFKANDGQADSAEATIGLTVSPVNDAPVAHEQSVSMAEDSHLPISLTASDVDNGPLGFTIASQPAHGTLLGTAPDLIYTPAPNYHGADSFTFIAGDGQADSAPTIVTILVEAMNDAPVAAAQEAIITEDTAAPITVSGIDADSDALTLVLLTLPTNGVLSGDLPNLLYTPAPNAFGVDYFTFKVNDGQIDSAPATVSIIVTPVNDPPVAGEQTISTSEDATVAIELAATDVESDSLTYAVVDGPAHGTLSGTAPSLVYSPAADYHGADSFTYKVNDSQADSALAAISINISPLNDAPVAADQNVTGSEDASQAVTLTATDADGDSLTYRIAVLPLHGTLSGTPPALLYQPTANFTGTDVFLFVARDGVTESPPAVITITVTPVNDAPLAQAQSLDLIEDTPAGIVLAGLDPENATLTYSVIVPPSHGSLTGTAPNLVYLPAPNFFGADSFTFEVTDGQATSAPSMVSLQVSAVNDAPVAEAGPDAAAAPGEQVALSGSGSTDPDDVQISYQWLQLDGPEVTLSDASSSQPVFVAPTVDVATSLSFMLTVSDGTLSADDVVTITVQPLNYDAYVVQDPVVTYGLLGGGGFAGTQVLNDGVVQTVTEVTSGSSGRSTLQVDYTLHTEASRTLVTGLSLYLAAMWSQLESADSLKVFIWDGRAWADITDDVMADGVFTPLAAPANYVDAEGNIRVRFADSTSLRNERKDTLTLDLLYAHIEVGPPDEQAPAPPSGLAGSASGTTVSLLWNANAEPDVAGYHVYRSTAAAGYQRVTPQLVTATTWQDATPEPGTYFYVVTAVDRNGNESPASAEIDVTTVQLTASVHVENISLTLEKPAKNYRAVAQVLVHDNSEVARPGVTVIGDWYFKGTLVQGGITAVTDALGQATLTSPYYLAKSGNIFTFRVTSLVLTGFEYSPGDNQQIEVSIGVP